MIFLYCNSSLTRKELLRSLSIKEPLAISSNLSIKTSYPSFFSKLIISGTSIIMLSLVLSIILLMFIIYFNSSKNNLVIDYENMLPNISVEPQNIVVLEKFPDSLKQFYKNYWKIEKIAQENALPIFIIDETEGKLVSSNVIRTSVLWSQGMKFIKDHNLTIDNFDIFLKEIKNSIIVNNLGKNNQNTDVIFNSDYLIINYFLYFELNNFINTIKQIDIKKGIKLREDLFEKVEKNIEEAVRKKFDLKKSNDKIEFGNINNSFLPALRKDISNFILCKANLDWKEQLNL